MTRLSRFRPCRPLLRLLSFAAIGAWLASCSSGPIERYYRLDSAVMPGPASPDTSVPVTVPDGPGRASVSEREIRLIVVAIPETIDRPQLVVQRGSHEVQLLEFDRWAEPVRSGIARTLAQGLGREFPGAWIVPDGRAGGDAAVTITVRIEAMEADAGEARIDARWRLAAGSRAAGLAQHRELRRATSGPMPSAAVAAWSAELAELAQAIARSVRELPADPQ
jgi:uncharacterized lipoprotein YmbA